MPDPYKLESVIISAYYKLLLGFEFLHFASSTSQSVYVLTSLKCVLKFYTAVFLNMQILVCVCIIFFAQNTVQGNDCYEIDLCACLEKIILCQNIFGAPDVLVSDPTRIEKFYISSSWISSLDFMDNFPKLQLLSLYKDVVINCTLVYQKEGTSSVHIDADHCPGM